MSIKHFSKDEFVNVAKDIMRNDTFISIRNADQLSENASFRDTLDVTSLDIAELIISLEEKYHVNMDWATTNNIDCINDVYDVFIKSIKMARQSKIAMSYSKQRQ